jgi:hypothetical protein
MIPERRAIDPTDLFYKPSIRPSDRSPVAFGPKINAAHPVAHCLCTWVWCPSIGGKDKPFAMKFWNRACPRQHFTLSGEPTDITV